MRQSKKAVAKRKPKRGKSPGLKAVTKVVHPHSKNSGRSLQLDDAEVSEIIAAIAERRAPPRAYLYKIFPCLPGVTVHWDGKTNETSSVSLPMQPVERIEYPGERQGTEPWSNKLIWGDNKLVLSSFLHGPGHSDLQSVGGLKLIYIDPPFDASMNFRCQVKVGEHQVEKEPSIVEQVAFRDTWGRNTESYLAMLYERLILMYDLLHQDGSLIVHIGVNLAPQVRLMLNEIFGEKNFVAEIIWQRTDPHNDAVNRPGCVSDRLLWYAKSDKFYYCGEEDRSELSDSATKEFSLLEKPDGEVINFRGNETIKGRRFKLDDATWKGKKNRFAWRGATPSPKREWCYASPEAMDEGVAKGELYLRNPEKGAARCRKRYLDENKGIRLQDIWTKVGVAKGGTEYPTQKPELLLERIIRIASRPGDLIADFFCGSGTTLLVAERLGRKWLGSDLGRFAIHTSRKRLIGCMEQEKTGHSDRTPFEIYNLGKYERHQFLSRYSPGQSQQDLQKKKGDQYIALIMGAYGGVQQPQATPFHGHKRDAAVFIGPADSPVTILMVQQLMAAGKARNLTSIDILGFDFEMGLVELCQKKQQRGPTISLRYIPKEVFDQRAVQNDEVVFYDAAYIKCAVSVRSRTVQVTLKDFVVFSSGDQEVRISGTKASRTWTAVRGGKLVQVAVDKQGERTERSLTRCWSDWVDYWAVDFNYLQQAPDNASLAADQPIAAFKNSWQSFRTSTDRSLSMVSAPHFYDKGGKVIVAVKVIDVFGNDTTKFFEVFV